MKSLEDWFEVNKELISNLGFVRNIIQIEKNPKVQLPFMLTKIWKFTCLWEI